MFLGIERFMLSFTNCIVMSGADALPCHAMQSIVMSGPDALPCHAMQSIDIG